MRCMAKGISTYFLHSLTFWEMLFALPVRGMSKLNVDSYCCTDVHPKKENTRIVGRKIEPRFKRLPNEVNNKRWPTGCAP